MYRFITVLIMFFPFVGMSQTPHAMSGGAETNSMAYSITNLEGTSALYGNIAGLADLKKWGVDVGYTRRYNLDELSIVSGAAGVNTSFGNFGFTFAQFGISEYSETKIGLAYARNLWSNLKVGAMFDMLSYNTQGYGQSTNFTFEVGAQLDVSKKVSLGVHVFNPVETKLNNLNTIPSRLSLGIRYEASSKAAVYAEVMKVSNRDPEFKVAINYDIAPELSLRLGANIGNSSLFFGTVYHFNEKVSVAGSMGFDNRIGNTPAVSLSYGE